MPLRCCLTSDIRTVLEAIARWKHSRSCSHSVIICWGSSLETTFLEPEKEVGDMYLSLPSLSTHVTSRRYLQLDGCSSAWVPLTFAIDLTNIWPVSPLAMSHSSNRGRTLRRTVESCHSSTGPRAACNFFGSGRACQENFPVPERLLLNFPATSMARQRCWRYALEALFAASRRPGQAAAALTTLSAWRSRVRRWNAHWHLAPLRSWTRHPPLPSPPSLTEWVPQEAHPRLRVHFFEVLKQSCPHTRQPVQPLLLRAAN
mmetsp:Transcript_6234/g.17454  ORF Transcript_6234/g.17454 Transcript_6234/m.17454 type:complete len:259 (+) Transcript_6234:657-1433(+)